MNTKELAAKLDVDALKANAEPRQSKGLPLLDPDAMPERDSLGFAVHPHYIYLDEGASLRQCELLYLSLGFDSVFLNEEHADGVVEGGSEARADHWNPESELSDGFYVIAIYETEDGVAAHAVKPRQGAKTLFVEGWE